VAALEKLWIKVVIFHNSKLQVLLQNKKLRELLSNHNPLKCNKLQLLQLLKLLQLKLQSQNQQLKLSQPHKQNQSKKPQKLNQKQPKLLNQKLQKLKNLHQLLIISKFMIQQKVLMISKLSLNLIPVQLFLET